MEELISVPVAADRLAVSETIVRRMVKRGELKPARISQFGRQVRRYFRASDVEEIRRKRSGEETTV